MKVYGYSEARQKLAQVLDEAQLGGEVRIRRRDGTEFSIRHVRVHGSPLDVRRVENRNFERRGHFGHSRVPGKRLRCLTLIRLRPKKL